MKFFPLPVLPHMTAKQMNFHAELKMMHQINHCVNETHKYEQPALSGWNEK